VVAFPQSPLRWNQLPCWDRNSTFTERKPSSDSPLSGNPLILVPDTSLSINLLVSGLREVLLFVAVELSK